jgi:ABC-type lipoprotein export system ATPase subunit
VAITDHCIIDVPRIRELQELGRDKITVLPGIELCSELGGSTPVHFIGIFSEDRNLEYIWEDLAVNLGLREKDIERRGGYQNVYTDLKEAAALIHKHRGLVSIHAGTKSNTVEAISSKYLTKQAQKTDLLKKQADILEVGKPQDLADYESIVFPAIGERLPVVICSDNHRATEYNVKADCWIKADPSFYGLLQTLIEPEERIHIGDKPPKRKRVAANRTKYVRSIRIRKKDGSTLDEAWFDGTDVELNHDLVAVIGNKGSGKSALAEVIGLVGNTRGEGSFSFLCPERFRTVKNNRAKHFEATLVWENLTEDYTPLEQQVDDTLPVKVKCIPQGMFEDICNDIATGAGSKFQQELRKVIFSHVPSAQRLGKASLDDLIEYLTDDTYDAIGTLKTQLQTVNERISAIEDQLTPEHRTTLANMLASKQQELASHDEVRPEQVVEPSVQTQPGLGEITNAISDAKGRRQKLRAEQSQAEKDEKEAALLVTVANRALQQIANFKEQFRLFKQQCSEELQALGLSFDEIVLLEIDTEPITKKRAAAEDSRLEAEKLLDAEEPESTVSQIAILDEEIRQLQTQLDEPSQRYEEYVSELEEWERKRMSILGNEEQLDSLTYYQEQLRRLDTLPTELDESRSFRWKITEEIYKKIEMLAEAYRELYAPVQEVTEKYEFAKEAFNLEFAVSVIDTELEGRFFDWVGRRVGGSFHGPEGEKRLKNLIHQFDFNQWPGVKAFLDALMDHLTKNKTTAEEPPVRIADQLKAGQDVVSLYNYIFSLDYLRPHYVLKLDGKELEQLSPGERGALLLIFYLLVDTDDIPLVIDQPEENLDNQTVYQMLVDAIKAAKERRQIIVVTHSPNLAVVCDAEQVICCSIDKQQGNRIEYVSGAIENPTINAKIVDILEGTKPALSNRWHKYAPFQGELV